MNRFATGLAISFGLIAIGAVASPARTGHAAEMKKVEGTSDNVWASGGVESNKAKVGEVAGRDLVIKVKNGDTVRFEVTGNQHGVIFENGKSQLANGVFEVVPAAGELELKDPSATTGDPVFLPAYYKHDDAKLTVKRGPGPIITVKIKDLKPGLGNGILFGCNPHSRPAANNNVMMLGVIVLDGDAKSKESDAYKK